MDHAIFTLCKLSHKQFRVMLKKFRRKKKRQQLAKKREQQKLLDQQIKESSPGYKEREEELRRNLELYDQFEEKERLQQNKLWLLREEQAQIEFRRKQQQLEIEKIKREEERKRIVAEFEKQQYVENQVLEETEKIKSQKEGVLQAALSNLAEEDGPWHNPIAPDHYNVGKEREQCMFFSKTGCCRFGDRCSRGHTRPEVSCTILIRGMYSHFSIDQTGRDDYDTDMALEYEDKERFQHFKTFYNDVVSEFKKFGKVVQFKVCNNFEPHLRGNVYVQFDREEEAIEAYKNFNGRYYAGKQITCEFTHVNRWRSAICGLHDRNLCPKGMNCNFLHVFKNPKDEFWEANRDLPPRGKIQNFQSSRRRERERGGRSNDYSSKYRYHHKYESRSDRNDYRDERHESRSDRRESRSERHESRSERQESRSERQESRSYRYQFKNNRYDSRSSGSSNDSSEEDERHSSKSRTFKNDDDNNFQHRKRNKDSKSSSGSNSPSEMSSERKSSHKKRKHKKKKSKKNKRHDDCSNS